MNVIVASWFDGHDETDRFQSVKHKAQVTLFPIYRSSSRSFLPWWASASVGERMQKYEKSLNCQSDSVIFLSNDNSFPSFFFLLADNNTILLADNILRQQEKKVKEFYKCCAENGKILEEEFFPQISPEFRYFAISLIH